MSRRLIFIVATAIACAEPATEAAPTHVSGDVGLVGAWDASMSLTQAYQLELAQPPARRICGTIGFIETPRALSGHAAAASGFLGVYDLDLPSLGLQWRGASNAPIASATSTVAVNRSRNSDSDSLTITLDTGSNELIVLRGARHRDEIKGRWTASSARGNASGQFQLRRRDPGNQNSLC